MKRMWFALGLACLLCCLPLLIPFVGVAGLAGISVWATGLPWPEVACLAAFAGMLVVGIIFAVRRRRRVSGPTCDVRH